MFDYYPPANNRFALVELDGDMDVRGDKTAARRVTIVRELNVKEIAQAAVDYTTARITSTKETLNDAERGAATASGTRGAATASGEQGAATASGWQGAATASGTQGAATASGDGGAATASGDWGAATASGTQGAATASGDGGAATASGCQGAATASGDGGAATASGYEGKARGKDGCALFLTERDTNREIIAVWAGIAGRDGIKGDTFYRLVEGKPVEVET